MSDIASVFVTSNIDLEVFLDNVTNVVQDRQDNGLIVDIQYSTTKDKNGDIQYSAFITGRLKK